MFVLLCIERKHSKKNFFGKKIGCQGGAYLHRDYNAAINIQRNCLSFVSKPPRITAEERRDAELSQLC